MKPLLKRIAEGEIIIADGAMGTQLAEHGVDLTACVEKINLDNFAVLEEIARSYYESGAEIVQTATFGASPLKLAMYELDHMTEQIIANAVDAVKNAVGDKAYVSGSVGPSGKMLKPYGDTEPKAMFDSFIKQMDCLVDSGVDIICVETMTDLAEAKLAIKAAKTVSPHTPVMATMTFDKTPKGYFTIMGVTIKAACDSLKEAGADIVGSNCGNGIEKMIEIATEFKKHTELPIIIQSNAGLPELVEGKLSYAETPDFMAEKAVLLKEAGVSIIGGCCGTTPEHIKTIRAAIK